MAEEARKEPSMEEILSSIRKIISDDDEPNAVGANSVTEDAGLDFGVDDPSEEYTAPVSHETAAFAPESAPDSPPVEELEPFAPEPVFETPAPQEKPPIAPRTASAALRSIARKDTEDMMTAPLSDDKTVGDAATYLSKLLDKVEFGEESGADTSIDNLVRELLRPMMKAWLDENLPAVVERQVEAEVARIARMAR